jgi:hypothetical protein
MRTSAAAHHGDDAVVARRMNCFVCSRSGHLTLLWQQVSHVDALPRVYYFYLCSNRMLSLDSWLILCQNLSEIALSHLDTQWGFTNSTPVEGRCVFAYAGILIKELCMP